MHEGYMGIGCEGVGGECMRGCEGVGGECMRGV